MSAVDRVDGDVVYKSARTQILRFIDAQVHRANCNASIHVCFLEYDGHDQFNVYNKLSVTAQQKTTYQ